MRYLTISISELSFIVEEFGSFSNTGKLSEFLNEPFFLPTTTSELGKASLLEKGLLDNHHNPIGDLEFFIDYLVHYDDFLMFILMGDGPSLIGATLRPKGKLPYYIFYSGVGMFRLTPAVDPSDDSQFADYGALLASVVGQFFQILNTKTGTPFDKGQSDFLMTTLLTEKDNRSRLINSKYDHEINQWEAAYGDYQNEGEKMQSLSIHSQEDLLKAISSQGMSEVKITL